MKKVERWNRVSNITLLIAVLSIWSIGFFAAKENGLGSVGKWCFICAAVNIAISLVLKIASRIRERNLYF